ncbi:hypothetical protein [Nesterenkonia sp. PF2B19]|uniref:hypothetical protein n=1 Tax=Nesterenkonia sp. PF2B19 TaxID=1881858 RepID=UPI000A19F17B|nr:hypothetical protein [Nesterenkonia sp. PF2B19]
MRLTQMDADYVLEFSEIELEALRPAEGDGDGTVGYARTRSLADAEEDGMIGAQILFTRAGDDVVMVSFIGEPAAAQEEFTAMAEAVTAATTEALAD